MNCLTLKLDGITAGDYLTWVRDPEPAALGAQIAAIHVEADGLGDTIELGIEWWVPPPGPRGAAALAGFPSTPEVISISPRRGTEAGCRQRRRRPARAVQRSRSRLLEPLG